MMDLKKIESFNKKQIFKTVKLCLLLDVVNEYEQSGMEFRVGFFLRGEVLL